MADIRKIGEVRVTLVEDRQAVIQEEKDSSVVVTEERQVVVQEEKDSVVSLAEDRHVVFREERDSNIVFGGEQGPIGPTGPRGAAGSANVEFNFAFGDATPASVIVAPAGKLVYGVQLHIKVPFNGVGAALVVGDATLANRLMGAAENDVTTVGSNTTAPAFVYGVDTTILLGITPGAGATQGSGVLILSIQQ